MSKHIVQIIENIESVLPIYDVNAANQQREDYLSRDKIFFIKEIEIPSNPNNDTNLNEFFLSDDVVINDSDEWQENFDDPIPDIDLFEVIEGRETFQIHLKKERNYNFMKKCKAIYKLMDKTMPCQICSFSFLNTFGALGENFIEGHHIVPLYELKQETKVMYKDILMVCSNCHRMLHKEYPCLSKEKLLELMQSNKKV